MFLTPDSAKPPARISPWDKAHRLPISGEVGPHCADSGTVFRINSTYMDVCDAAYVPHDGMLRLGTPAALSVIGAVVSIYLLSDYWEPIDALKIMGWIAAAGGLCYLVSLMLTYGLFGLTRHTVRFDRKTRMVHTVRRRRWFAARAEGDVTWSIPWNQDQLFCVHRHTSKGNTAYYIRHYELDGKGQVLRAFCIGREWARLDELLAQWSYWCRFMNHGPASLPRPRLWLSETEPVWESYVISQCGPNKIVPVMLLIAPYTLAMTVARRLWRLTCRAPRWPAEIELASVIEANDMFDQPQAGTPVGFVQTRWAVWRSRYPANPFFTVEDWKGQSDPLLNAKRWSAERPRNIVPGDSGSRPAGAPLGKSARKAKARQVKEKSRAARGTRRTAHSASEESG